MKAPTLGLLQQQESQSALTKVMLAGQQAQAAQATAQSEALERMMNMNAESQERMLTTMLGIVKGCFLRKNK